VTEHDFRPKRVSVWTPDGKLIRAFYGPGRYGGGGTLDPRDTSRFYYDGIEFKLDWATGANAPAAIFYRDGQDEVGNQSRAGPPEAPIYVGGRQYMTNCYNSNPTGGHPTVGVWLMRDGVAVPVASCGRAGDWPLLRTDAFKPRWPAGVDPVTSPKADRSKQAVTFVWADANGDGRVQPDEVAMTPAAGGGVTVGPDLSFLLARLGDRAVRLAPQRFTPQGVPLYDLAAAQTLAEGAQQPASSGGDQALVTPDGWAVLTVAPKPFAREGFAGLKDGVPMWSYPSLWPGLHASHEAPVPDRPGEVIGSTRLLGGFVTPRAGDAGPIWCVNGNEGTAYLFTADGLFVGRLFQDSRAGKPWAMPRAERGMRLNDVTLHDENFYPSIAQAADGRVYLCDGARTSLVRVDGLDGVRRLPPTDLAVSAADLAAAAAWRVEAEARRQAARGTGTLVVSVRPGTAAAPVVDGRLDDWAGADWAVVDRRGTAAHFNSDSKPYDVTAAVAVAGDRLYAAFRTREPDLLANSGEVPNAPFKTGGCLDLMIGADAAADPKRPRPAAGDQRLLVTRVGGKTVALLYRAVVPGTKDPVPFSSPWRTVTIDRVEDVSADVRLAGAVDPDEKGKSRTATYELSVPLARLGLTPTDGMAIKGDVGVLRGDGARTTQRAYWSNKATAITADVPSEAELTPALWGRWQFRTTP
ncbi:MAG: repeat containing protein, partial [Phycisphaerales bacterium]|nr:repeat containing protein [Phycisphaerales bacterium]